MMAILFQNKRLGCVIINIWFFHQLTFRLFNPQVVATEEGLEPPSEVPKPKREDGLEENLAKHIGHLAYKLALSEEEQGVRVY